LFDITIRPDESCVSTVASRIHSYPLGTGFVDRRGGDGSAAFALLAVTSKIAIGE